MLDPAELGLVFDQASIFRDAETGRTLYVDPAAARKSYVEKLEAHCAELRRICDKLGIAYHRLATDQPLELALFDFLQQRMHRGTNARAVAGSPGNLPA